MSSDPAVGVDGRQEPYPPGEDPSRDRLEAAAKLIGNHAAVTRFAARAVGSPGSRPVSAPLSDPTAKPGEAHLPAVDAALRAVAHALLAGPPAAALRAAPDDALPHSAGAAAASAAYLRDRVGVPRDMRLPAARQLRAHLNWAIDALGGAESA